MLIDRFLVVIVLDLLCTLFLLDDLAIEIGCWDVPDDVVPHVRTETVA